MLKNEGLWNLQFLVGFSNPGDQNSSFGVNYRDKANADGLVGKPIEYAWESLSDSKVPGKPVGLFIRDMIGSESRF